MRAGGACCYGLRQRTAVRRRAIAAGSRAGRRPSALARAGAGATLGCLLACSTPAHTPAPRADAGTPAAAAGTDGAAAGTGSNPAADAGGERPDARVQAPGSGTDAGGAGGGEAALDGGAAHDAGDAGAGDAGTLSSAARFETRELAAAPSYLGSVDDGADCTQSYPSAGFEPVDPAGARHPLFLYFVGTAFVSPDTSASYDSQAAQKVTEAMARRGFVALSAQYDNSALAWLSDHENQLACMFGPNHASSLLAVACALPQVDCDLGIATWGHSQGALVAHLAARAEPRVRAVWTTGYGGDARATLSPTRLRVVNGEGDTGNAVVSSLNTTAGFSDAECPDDGRKQCLRDDGSGWIIVQRADCQLSSADHCWFDKLTCADSAETLEPNWIDPASTKPFALETNADWVARTALRP